MFDSCFLIPHVDSICVTDCICGRCFPIYLKVDSVCVTDCICGRCFPIYLKIDSVCVIDCIHDSCFPTPHVGSITCGYYDVTWIHARHTLLPQTQLGQTQTRQR